jgi:putative endonuclease
MKDYQYYVYRMANKPKGTLYIGVTNNLARRVYEHRNGLIDGFTKKYDIKLLVYLEVYEYVYHALQREKALKRWQREWKIKRIEESNPYWKDLYEILCI